MDRSRVMRSIPRRLFTLLIAALLGIGALGLLSEVWFLNLNLSYRTGDYYDAIICRHSIVYTASKDSLVHLMFKPGERQWRVTSSIYSVRGANITRREWWPGMTPGTWASQPQIIIPFWWAAPLAAVLFGARLLFRRVRRKPYECRGCRYDLRGLPKDAAACPECGAAIASGMLEDAGMRRKVGSGRG